MSNHETKTVSLTPVKFEVLHHGAMLMETAFVYEGGDTVRAILVSMKSKHGDLHSVGGEDECPTISIQANEDSLYLDDSYPRGEPTEIIFPEYKGWQVWSVNISKYSIYLCLVKK